MDPACGAVFNARTRLYGEPGLTADQRAWTALVDSAVALAAVCGEATLLQVPPGPAESFAVAQARDRWQKDLPRQLEVACAHLRDAASALDRSTPC